MNRYPPFSAPVRYRELTLNRHVFILKLLLKMRKSCLKVFKAFITIGRITAIETVVQFRILQEKKCLYT